MNGIKFTAILWCVFAALLSMGQIVFAMNDIERAKIEYLISSVNELKGARFIRNGSEYDTAAASNHLRRKLKAAGNKISTAEQFIEYCASKSSISGEPYTIRMSEGIVVQSGTYFRERLKSYPENGDKSRH